MVAEMRAAYGRVSTDQRFKRAEDCPICHGGDSMKRGQGVRCWGYLSADARYAFCTNDDFAGSLTKNARTGAYQHKLDGDCWCGDDHGAEYRPPQRATDAPRKITQAHKSRTPTAIYDYGDSLRFLRFTDADGKKSFVWQHFDRDHGWIDGREGLQPGLYRADSLASADPRKLVFIVEGEKCVDALTALGAVAVCNPDGAGCWRDEYAPLFEGRHVVILADADESGRAHTETESTSVTPVAASARSLELEGAHDVADWLADGHTLLELLEIVAATPVKSNSDFTSEPTVPDDYETLKAQNRSFNEKLLWIYEVIGGRRLTHAQKCALIMVRKNSEWSVNEPWPKESEQSVKMRAQGFTPDTLGSLARQIGASEKSTNTVSKYLQVLKAEELIAVEPFTETKTVTKEDGSAETVVLPRLAYATLPAASQPKVYAQPKAEHQETRGGSRPDAGRKPKCVKPGCGSEEFTPASIHRELHAVTVRVSLCKKCGTPHREILSDELVASERIPEDESVKSEFDFTIPTPDEETVTAERECKDTTPPPDSIQCKVDSHAAQDTPADELRCPECGRGGDMLKDYGDGLRCRACDVPVTERRQP